MNLRLSNPHWKYQKNCACRFGSREFWGGVFIVAMLYFCGSVIWEAVAKPVAKHELLKSERGVMYMWEYESTPADRAVILNKLSAKECIDAGLCELVVKLPTTEW